MTEEQTKEEIERRARATLERLLATPPQPKKKPRAAIQKNADASKPRKRERPASAS